MDHQSILIVLSLIHLLKKVTKRVKIDTNGGEMVIVGLSVCGLGNGKIIRGNIAK